jgi:hypothetical protein
LRCLDANIRLKEIKSLTQQYLLPRTASTTIVFLKFFAHFFHRNVIPRRFLSKPRVDVVPRNLDAFLFGNPMQNEIVFNR